VITWPAVGSAHGAGFQYGAVSAGSAPGQLWRVNRVQARGSASPGRPRAGPKAAVDANYGG
jgi:hypothetical protein